MNVSILHAALLFLSFAGFIYVIMTAVSLQGALRRFATVRIKLGLLLAWMLIAAIWTATYIVWTGNLAI